MHLINGIINLHSAHKMDWLRVEDGENQDMEHEFIGNLILEKGFKVRYTNVEVYTDSMRERFKTLFKKHGYDIKVKYNNNYAYVEITATQRKVHYVEFALIIALLWALYRVYTHIL